VHSDPTATAEQHLKELRFGGYGRQSGGTTRLLSLKKSKLKPPDDKPVETLMEVQSTPYLRSYEWIEPDRKTRYAIVVARPYWLSQFAAAPDKVIWAPVGASLIECVMPKKNKK